MCCPWYVIGTCSDINVYVNWYDSTKICLNSESNLSILLQISMGRGHDKSKETISIR